MWCWLRGHKPSSPFPNRPWAFQLNFTPPEGGIKIVNVHTCERCGVLFVTKEK